MNTKRLLTTLLIVLLLLSIPFVAGQFSEEVNWDLMDYVVMGAMLLIAGLAIELITRKSTSKNAKTIAIVVIVVLFLLLWAELGVGIFGTSLAGN